MTGPSGNAERPREGMVVVRVADQVNQALTGQPGCRYESPPQCRQQALALVEVVK